MGYGIETVSRRYRYTRDRRPETDTETGEKTETREIEKDLRGASTERSATACRAAKGLQLLRESKQQGRAEHEENP
jgi:hypothetical protein